MYSDLLKNTNLFKIEYPKTVVPNPTNEDYNAGFIRRYFVRRSNDVAGHIFEISEESYSAYVNNESPYWIAETIKWRISGPIEKTFKPDGNVADIGVKSSNKAALGIASAKLPNIRLYIPNLLQFYRR